MHSLLAGTLSNPGCQTQYSPPQGWYIHRLIFSCGLISAFSIPHMLLSLIAKNPVDTLTYCALLFRLHSCMQTALSLIFFFLRLSVSGPVRCATLSKHWLHNSPAPHVGSNTPGRLIQGQKWSEIVFIYNQSGESQFVLTLSI